MNIIIMILIALSNLMSAHVSTESNQSNQATMAEATAIYNSGDYTEVDGGVIIDIDVNP